MLNAVLLKPYQEHLKVTGYAPETIHHYATCASNFLGWLKTRRIQRIQDATKDVVRDYHSSLYAAKRRRDGASLSLSTKAVRIAALISFFRWLVKSRHILYNPASDLDRPRVRKDSLRETLTEKDMKRLLESVDTSDRFGIRDRAILELLYSTGIRNSELRCIEVPDVDLERQELTIRQAKGRFGPKQRVVPFGRVSKAWVEEYLHAARPKLLGATSSKALFLSKSGRKLTIGHPNKIVKTYAKSSGIKKNVCAHMLRHTCATHLLRHGCDIRHVQAILGHESLDSTKLYTHIEISHLKKIHRKTHPRERA